MHNFYDALPSMPAVGLQRGMDLWGDDVAFCQITLTSFGMFMGDDHSSFGIESQGHRSMSKSNFSLVLVFWWQRGW